jgi:hypothetical protein
LLLALILVGSNAWSGDANLLVRDSGNKQAKGERIGTKISPLFVKADITSKQDVEESKRETKEREIKAEVDAALVKYNFWLTLLTGGMLLVAAIQAGLFVWQLALMHRATSDAGIAAKAAEKAANIAERSLTDLERPIVYGVVSEPGLAIVGILSCSDLQLCILNCGRTPANLTRIEHKISIAPHGEIAPTIDPNVVIGRELPVGTFAANGDPFFETENMRLRFVNEAQSIIENTQSVWIVGFVRYEDIFGGHYITGFTHVFDPISGRFVRRGDERYNYARKENPDDIPSLP